MQVFLGGRMPPPPCPHPAGRASLSEHARLVAEALLEGGERVSGGALGAARPSARQGHPHHRADGRRRRHPGNAPGPQPPPRFVERARLRAGFRKKVQIGGGDVGSAPAGRRTLPTTRVAQLKYFRFHAKQQCAARFEHARVSSGAGASPSRSLSDGLAEHVSSRLGLAGVVGHEAHRREFEGPLDIAGGPWRITPRTWSTDTGFHGNATRPQVAPAAA